MGHFAKLVSGPVTALKFMTQMTSEEHRNRLEQDRGRLRREIKNLANDDGWYTSPLVPLSSTLLQEVGQQNVGNVTSLF